MKPRSIMWGRVIAILLVCFAAGYLIGRVVGMLL